MERLAHFLCKQQLKPQLLWPLLPTLRASLLEKNPLASTEADAFLLALAFALQGLFCQMQADKASSHLAFLGKHFAFLLHEIANPLAIAETSAFRLQHLLSAQGPPAAMEPLAQLQTQLASLLETLYQIRMLAWEEPKAPKTCLLSLTLEKALAALPRHEELQVQAEGLHGLGVVQAEPTQLGWVWKNLFENALRAMEGKGNLLVRAEPGPQQISVFVEDSGPGINEHLRAHLFEPFVSGYAERTGLGLALAKTILERHGGSISLQQSRWGGSSFVVHLLRALPLSPSLVQ